LPLIEPKIEGLLDKVDNQYTLVVISAKRARQVVDYFTKLGAGLEEKPLPPLIPNPVGLKPLSIALREIKDEKVGFERPAGTEESVK
jgi:DNA-directed RNA polymerase subunit omega